MCKLFFEIWSYLDKGQRSPSNGSWEIVSCSDWIDSEYKKVRINAHIHDFLNNPKNCAISSWNNDPQIRLHIVNILFDELKLFLFLLGNEEIGEIDVCGPIWLVLELDLGKVMDEILVALAVAAFGVDEEEEVIIGSCRGLGDCLFHFAYNSFLNDQRYIIS